MHAIVGPEDLEFLGEEGKLVGILVAQQIDLDPLDWIFRSWPGLHDLSGANWHIAIPCEANPERPDPPPIHEFNIPFSNRLRDMYGIDPAELPVLVLDDFRDESRQLYLKISHNQGARIAMLRNMAEFIKGYVQDPTYPGHNDLGRYKLIGALYNHIQSEQIFHAFVNFASNSVSGALRLFRGGL
jgi:hypothetical protein